MRIPQNGMSASLSAGMKGADLRWRAPRPPALPRRGTPRPRPRSMHSGPDRCRACRRLLPEPLLPGVGRILHTDRMVSFADKPILDLTVKEWEEYLAGEPSVDGVRLKLRKKSSSAPGMTWTEALDVALSFG